MSISAGSLPGMSQISVSIGPGMTNFTSTPLPAMSRYIASANPHIAYFAALYADSFAIGIRPPMLETHTIVPDFRSSIFGNNASVMRTGEWKLTFIVSSTSSNDIRDMCTRFGIAALCTTASSPPNASHASSASFGRGEIGEVHRPHTRLGASLLAAFEHFFETVGAARDDADGRAALGEDRCERGADTRRRAGQEDLRAFELHRLSFASDTAFSRDSCSAHE